MNAAVEDRWALASDCFWIASLAQAAGLPGLARSFFIVGVDWLAGAQERSRARPSWLAVG